MKAISQRLVILGLTSVCAALQAGCERTAPAPVADAAPQPRWLTIVTPHNDTIRTAFNVAFNEFRQQSGAEPVYIDWVVRGTPECVKYVQDVAAGGGRGEARDRADVLFGGGITDHQLLAQRGLTRQVKLDDLLKDVPAEIAGLPTRDPAGNWFATGLSSFGIVFNERAAALRGIPAPTGWDSLSEPALYGWVGVADPSASGSHLQCMILQVQKHGWKDGWSRIIRTLANSRGLVERSAVALRQTQNGVFLATYGVNFDGQQLERETNGMLRYIDPPGATALTPDVVSVLTTAQHVDLAEQFVRYTLGEQGQALWSMQPDQREDQTPLYHYPVLPVIYEKFAGKLSVAQNPFTADPGVRYDLAAAAKQAQVLPVLVSAATSEGNHILLQQAWEAIIAAKMKPDALEELVTPPLDENAAYELGAKVAAGPDAAETVRAELEQRFAEKFKKARGLASAR